VRQTQDPITSACREHGSGSTGPKPGEWGQPPCLYQACAPERSQPRAGRTGRWESSRDTHPTRGRPQFHSSTGGIGAPAAGDTLPWPAIVDARRPPLRRLHRHCPGRSPPQLLQRLRPGKGRKQVSTVVIPVAPAHRLRKDGSRQAPGRRPVATTGCALLGPGQRPAPAPHARRSPVG